MKKLFYVASALLLLGAAACNKSDSSNAKSDLFSPEATDSLVSSFGTLVGMSLNTEMARAMEQDSTVTKAAFIKGLQYAFAADTTQAYAFGMNIGMQIQNELKRFEKMGIVVDKSTWLNAFKKAFMQDSVPSQQQISLVQQEFQVWNDSLRNSKRRFELQAIENSDQSQANLKAAKRYVDSIKAKDPAVQVTPSGIAYKIENEGQGPKVQPSDRVVAKVESRALNGQNPPALPANQLVVTAFPKGLQEAICMLAKGAKATFYVPGRMVYELDMAQRMGMEPNTLIIYDVEIEDIPATPAAPAAINQPVRR